MTEGRFQWQAAVDTHTHTHLFTATTYLEFRKRLIHIYWYILAARFEFAASV